MILFRMVFLRTSGLQPDRNVPATGSSGEPANGAAIDPSPPGVLAGTRMMACSRSVVRL